jgi:hypothetical protein
MFAQCGLNLTKCLANLQCLVTFLWQRKLIKPTPAGGILFGSALVLENNATMGPIIFKKFQKKLHLNSCMHANSYLFDKNFALI